MATLVWPVSLPQVALAKNFSRSPADNTIRTKMSAGPDKVRCRGSAAVQGQPVRYSMTTDQMETLDYFYKTETGGAEEFSWPGPFGDESLMVRFTSPPKYTYTGPDLWEASVELEILP